MNIRQNTVDPKMPVGIHSQEATRLLNANAGAVLFTGKFYPKNITDKKEEQPVQPNDEIKALLKRIGVQFITCYFPESHTVQFVKEA